MLTLFQENQFLLKHSTCAFGAFEVEYLGHIVSLYVLRVDPKKVIAMKDWPHLKTLEIFHGFLGLTSYYQKFVKNYGKIVAPLTSLLENNAFVCSEVAEKSLFSLKDAIFTTPILVLHDFTKTFVLKCDSFDRGLEAILMQEGCPLAFINKQLCDHNLGKSTYEMEMIATLHAWRPSTPISQEGVSKSRWTIIIV